VRVDVTGPTITNEATTSSVLGNGETFYRIPRRHVYDRHRDRVYLIADAAVYVVEPSDWLTPITSIDIADPANGDFWNGVHSRSDDLLYIFESGIQEGMQSPLDGGGVAGDIAIIDPAWMQRVDKITRGEIEGGDQMAYISTLDLIVGAPRRGNWEVYSPDLRQSLYRRAIDDVPGAALDLGDRNQLCYISQFNYRFYDY